MALQSINYEQRLYVIGAGDGYSCLGFDVLEERMAGYLRHLSAHGVDGRGIIGTDAMPGTAERFQQYQAILSEVARLWQEKHIRCESELTPQLVGLEGKRVEVVDRYGEKRRFIVGKSTGWVPIHLEIARHDSTGGGGVTGAPFKSVRVVSAGRGAHDHD